MRLSRPFRCLSCRGFLVDKGGGSGWARLIWPGYLRGLAPSQCSSANPRRQPRQSHKDRVAMGDAKQMGFSTFRSTLTPLQAPGPQTLARLNPSRSGLERGSGAAARNHPDPTSAASGTDCVTTRFSRERPSGNIERPRLVAILLPTLALCLCKREPTLLSCSATQNPRPRRNGRHGSLRTAAQARARVVDPETRRGRDRGRAARDTGTQEAQKEVDQEPPR